MNIVVTGGSGFIGTNLVDYLLAQGHQVTSFDVASPRKPAHRHVFVGGDVTDSEAIESCLAASQPDVVYHLAARTDLDGASVEDYTTNTVGTAAVVEACERLGFTGRLVHVSSMLVCRNGYSPNSATDYCPSTAYGESKVQGEEIVRASDAGFEWVICRPTSIWGPWFATPYRDFFDAVRRGRYVHPRGSDVVKAFGYVDNAVQQMVAAAHGPAGETHYLADRDRYTVAEFAREVASAAGVAFRAWPIPVMRALAWGGDALQLLKLTKNAPLTSFRLANMMTPSSFDTEAIESIVDEVVGTERIDLRTGVESTMAWLENAGG